MKFPEVGKVKSRLGAEVGDERATEIYIELVFKTLMAIPATGSDVWLFIEPAGRLRETFEMISRRVPLEWVSRARLVGQPGGDLGVRLETVFRDGLGEGFERVLAVGTDCPDLREEHFAAAWEALDTADVVIGPAADGGYYLIGMRQPAPELFRGIPWSSSVTLAATLQSAAGHGLSVALLETLRDVDTADDWRAFTERTQPGSGGL